MPQIMEPESRKARFIPNRTPSVFEAAVSNPEWEHVYCAAVLAANTSMRGVEVKHVRRRNIDLEKVWDVESATGKGVLYVTRSKNETSKRPIPLNQAAKEAVERMLRRADTLGHKDPDHYVWCSNQHHKFDPTKPAEKWDTAWRALRAAAGSCASRRLRRRAISLLRVVPIVTQQGGTAECGQ